MSLLQGLSETFLHLMFPRTCAGCGIDLQSRQTMLCLRCLHLLSPTYFEYFPGNPVEKKFYGRIPLAHASARYYFTKDSLASKLVHQVKYQNSPELCIQLGKLMGEAIFQSGRFNADTLIPLPLFPARERKRGYNQSQLLCEGISRITRLPILPDVVTRPHQTETQTKKGRIERWKNIDGKFFLTKPEAIEGRHLLLVDDVITTGATIESCGETLLRARDVTLSVACLCYAFR